MITAQVLITVLVVQWFMMQYNKEHNLLSDNISRAWDAANQQMIDSMLMKQYIYPLLDSSGLTKDLKPKTITTNESESSDGTDNSSHTNINTGVKSGNQETDNSQQTLIFKLNHDSSPPLPPNSRRIFVHTDNADSIMINTGEDELNDMALRGLQLFVTVQHDSLGENRRMGLPDTALLKKALQVQLYNVDTHITVTWRTDSISNQGETEDTGNTRETIAQKAKRQYSYSIMVNDHAIQADIGGWHRVIVARLLPWGLFGLLLVILSAAAFLFSYRSLRTQMLLNVQRNDFVRNMSHELRTPVATVKVALEAISDFNDQSDRQMTREYLSMAILETNRLEMLINRATDLMAEGKLHIITKSEDLSGLLKEVAMSMKPRLNNEKASLTLTGVEQPVYALIDNLHLKGVLINLIDNSLKYSDAPAIIDINLATNSEKVIITVADRGKGIAVEYRSRVFEKFFRVPQGDTHNIKGYGLGLTYADTVIKQHGGTISYLPRDGGGSVFEIQLNKI